MPDEKSKKIKLEEGSKVLKDAEGKLDNTQKSLGNSVQKVTSPFEQKKEEFDAAKKMLSAKELLYEESKNRTNKSMSDVKSKAQATKNNIENAQSEFQKASELVKSLLAKFESQAGGKL